MHTYVWYIHTCKYIYMYLNIRIPVCIVGFIHIHTYMHSHMHTHIRIPVCIVGCIHIHTYIQSSRSRAHARFSRSWAYVSFCIYLYVYAYIHTYTYVKLLYTQYTCQTYLYTLKTYFIYPSNLIWAWVFRWNMCVDKKNQKTTLCIRPLPFSSGPAHALAHANHHQGDTRSESRVRVQNVFPKWDRTIRKVP